MKKYFTRLLAMVCFLAAGVSANAQYSKVVEQYPRTSYATDAIEFNLEEIATALGTDTASVMRKVESVAPDFFYLDGAEDPAYNCSPNGYWLDKDAAKQTWGDNAFWYVTLDANAEANVLTLNVGQFPGHFEGGEETAVAHLALAIGDKKVTFDISLKILRVDVPEATTLYSKLDIVGRLSTEVHQWARSNTKADVDTVDFKGVAALLGTTPEILSLGMSKILYATKTNENSESDQFGFKTDSLTNVSTADAPGFWFGNPFDGYDEFVSVGSNNGLFYADAFELDSETEALTFDIGQQGGAFPIEVEGMDPITSAQSKVYFIFGDKAVELTIKLVIDERDRVPFAEMIEVGSEDVNLSQYPTSDYSYVSFSLDLDAIAALLECETADISLWAPDGNGDITDEASAANDGFWFHKDGYRYDWGSACGIFVENPTSGDYSKFNVGQYPNVFEGGETAVATLYFVCGDKYYTVNVKLEIKEKEGPGIEFESVAQRAVAIQIIPASNYGVEMTYTVDAEDYELIGTTTPTLYGRKNPGAGSEWTDGYSDTYTCTPYPGFWMSSDGYPRVWSISADDFSPWGITYADDTFTFYQIPNHNKVGDVYTAVLYLVNEDTGKMISYNMTIKFVSTVTPQAEVVGRENILLPVEADGETYTTVDVSKAVEALGLESASQFISINSLSAQTEDGAMSEAMSAANGVFIMENGAMDSDPDGNNSPVSIEFRDNGEKELVFVVTEWKGYWEENQSISTRIGFQYEGKIYIYNVTFVSQSVYTGIQEAKTGTSNSVLFDLSGRRVENARRGIFIQNGKKVVK